MTPAALLALVSLTPCPTLSSPPNCPQYTWFFLLNFVFSWILILFGSLINLSFFRRTSYSFQFVFYWLWVNCLVSFAFLLSTLFKSAKTAVVVVREAPGVISLVACVLVCLGPQSGCAWCGSSVHARRCWPHHPVCAVQGFLYVFGTGLVGVLLLQTFISEAYWW